MTDYRYILDKGSKKFRCPGCNKKRFVRYVDRKEDRYLPEKYGRCDREVNCGYFLNPYEDKSLPIKGNDWRNSGVNDSQVKQPDPKFIPYQLFKKSRSRYEENTFVQFLLKLFDDSTVSELIQKYHLGTSSKIKGGCIFYQIDIEGSIRRGKIMVYDSEGHKQGFNSVHSQLGWKEFKPDYRYFGEHLLADSDKPVAVVESEKTAIIASVYFPDYDWIATTSKNRLNPEHAQCLIGKQVTLFPDLDAYEDWREKADELSYFCNINTSDILETIANANDKKKGYDLADYLIQFDVDDFKQRDKATESKFEGGYPDSWDEVTLDEGAPEYEEATKHAINDAAPDELQELCKRDPIIQKMIDLFDGEVTLASLA